MGYAKKPGRRAVAKFSWRREVYEAQTIFVKRRNTLRSRTSQSGTSPKRRTQLEVKTRVETGESSLEENRFCATVESRMASCRAAAGLSPDVTTIMMKHYSGRSPVGDLSILREGSRPNESRLDDCLTLNLRVSKDRDSISRSGLIRPSYAARLIG